MTNISDKDLELIGKLEALRTNSGATEGEVQNAAAAMQRILFKYNLDMSAVESMSFGNKKTAAPEFQREWNDLMGLARKYNKSNRSNSRQWLVDLAFTVARYNFCRALSDSQYMHITFVGKPDNIAAVKSIWHFIAEQIAELREEGYKTYSKGTPADYRTDARLWKRNFAAGAVIRVGNRMYEDWQKLQQEFVESKALIVVNDTALVEFVQKISGGKTLKDNGGKNKDGIAEGFAAGDKVALKNHTRLS